MNKGFPRSLRRIVPNLVHAVAITGFFLLFALFYSPAALVRLLETGEEHYAIPDMYSFNLAICCAIIFVSMLLLRSIMFLLKNKLTSSFLAYVVWCVFEVLFTSAFTALYFCLMSMYLPHGPSYFNSWANNVSILAGIFIYPYTILTMVFTIQELRQGEPVSEGARIKFYDNRHLLKFATTVSSVLYIEAEENYISIHYLENGIPKKVQVRNSMKSLEELCDKNGFVRVHRSYYLNPSHVMFLRKEKEGFYYADLDSGDGASIPVSKRYYDVISAIL